MRLAFFGTPAFAVPALDALAEAGHQIACVYTQPPRRAGRGHRETRSPVHLRADALGIAVRTPKTLKDGEAQAAFAALALDAAVVVAFGLILPKAILDAPRLGCINIHASLLPRWRGAAPIQRAIQAGDARTGVTIMAMDEGLDTGPELLKEKVSIGPATNAGELHDTLAGLGAKLVVEALAGLGAGTIRPMPQAQDGATYASKIERGEERIDWTRPARALDCHIRAFAPSPGAWCEHEGVRLKVLAARVVEGHGAPGTVLDEALTVACGEGALRLTTVQREGRAPMAATELLRGHPIAKGTVLT